MDVDAEGETGAEDVKMPSLASAQTVSSGSAGGHTITAESQMQCIIRLAHTKFAPDMAHHVEYNARLHAVAKDELYKTYKSCINAGWVEDIGDLLNEGKETDLAPEQSPKSAVRTAGEALGFPEVEVTTWDGRRLEETKLTAETLAAFKDPSDDYIVPNYKPPNVVIEGEDDAPSKMELIAKSKAMAYCLRHALDTFTSYDRELKNGYVSVMELVHHKECRRQNLTLKDIAYVQDYIEKSENKPRYSISDDRKWIRAIQGHKAEMVDRDKIHRRITIETMADDLRAQQANVHSRFIVHQTDYTYLPSILTFGLIAGGTEERGKDEVFCARINANTNFTIDVMGNAMPYKTSKGDAIIKIDLEAFLKDGGIAYMTEGRNILLLGDLSRPIDPKYFISGLCLKKHRDDSKYETLLQCAETSTLSVKAAKEYLTLFANDDNREYPGKESEHLVSLFSGLYAEFLTHEITIESGLEQTNASNLSFYLAAKETAKERKRALTPQRQPGKGKARKGYDDWQEEEAYGDEEGELQPGKTARIPGAYGTDPRKFEQKACRYFHPEPTWNLCARKACTWIHKEAGEAALKHKAEVEEEQRLAAVMGLGQLRGSGSRASSAARAKPGPPAPTVWDNPQYYGSRVRTASKGRAKGPVYRTPTGDIKGAPEKGGKRDKGGKPGP